MSFRVEIRGHDNLFCGYRCSVKIFKNDTLSQEWTYPDGYFLTASKDALDDIYKRNASVERVEIVTIPGLSPAI